MRGNLQFHPPGDAVEECWDVAGAETVLSGPGGEEVSKKKEEHWSYLNLVAIGAPAATMFPAASSVDVTIGVLDAATSLSLRLNTALTAAS